MSKQMKDISGKIEEVETKDRADSMSSSALSPLGDGVINQQILNPLTNKFEVALFNFEIKETTPATMDVIINDGSALIKGQIIGSSKIKQNQAVASLTIGAADPANSRKDLIVLKTDINQFGEVKHRGNAKQSDFLVIQGVASASPSVALTDSQLNELGQIRIGTINIPAGAVSITLSDIDNSKDYLSNLDNATGISDYLALTDTPNSYVSDGLKILAVNAGETGIMHLTQNTLVTMPLPHTHVKANITDFAHTHLKGDITDFFHVHISTDITDKGLANGLATLDSAGKIPNSQMPNLAITSVAVVADIISRDALTVQSGDVAVVTSNLTSYIYDGTVWIEIKAPTGSVASVNGQTGTVVLTNTDVSAAAVVHTHGKSDITDFAHTHLLSDIADSGTSASKNIPAAGDASAIEVVLGSDTRLTDSRVPLAHTHTESDLQITSLNPSSDNTGNIGTDILRWNRIRATNVVTGDLHLIDETKNANWTVIEEADCLTVKNNVSGKLYKLTMTEV